MHVFCDCEIHSYLLKNQAFWACLYEMVTCCMSALDAAAFIHYKPNSYSGPDCCFHDGIICLSLFSYKYARAVKHIVISKGTELLRVPQDCLMYVSSDGNYSNVVTQDGHTYLLCLQLGQIEDLIGDQLGDDGGNFLRIGRRLIINTDFIYLIDVTKQLLILSDCKGSRHELTASYEALSKLKTYVETIMK